MEINEGAWITKVGRGGAVEGTVGGDGFRAAVGQEQSCRRTGRELPSDRKRDVEVAGLPGLQSLKILIPPLSGV